MYNPEKPIEKESVIRRAEMVDAPIIFDLLRKNLHKNLTEEERKEGFIFYEPTDEEMGKIINDTGVYLSLKGDELKGYFITMSKALAETIPFEAELLHNADSMTYEDKSLAEYNYSLLAQIVIAKEYRGTMTFNRLHLHTQTMLKEQGFELGVGEVADNNLKSLAVHSYLTDIGKYTSKTGTRWHILVSDLRKD